MTQRFLRLSEDRALTLRDDGRLRDAGFAAAGDLRFAAVELPLFLVDFFAVLRARVAAVAPPVPVDRFLFLALGRAVARGFAPRAWLAPGRGASASGDGSDTGGAAKGNALRFSNRSRARL